jgi:hypothetical protein
VASTSPVTLVFLAYLIAALERARSLQLLQHTPSSSEKKPSYPQYLAQLHGWVIARIYFLS